EDGIRHRNVTGVQTCALPISQPRACGLCSDRDRLRPGRTGPPRCGAGQVRRGAPHQAAPGHARAVVRSLRGPRSRAAGRDVMTALLPTSTAGSLPKPSWLAQPETLWSPWKLDDGELAEGKRAALRLSLAEQQAAGIDIVS